MKFVPLIHFLKCFLRIERDNKMVSLPIIMLHCGENWMGDEHMKNTKLKSENLGNSTKWIKINQFASFTSFIAYCSIFKKEKTSCDPSVYCAWSRSEGEIYICGRNQQVLNNWWNALGRSFAKIILVFHSIPYLFNLIFIRCFCLCTHHASRTFFFSIFGTEINCKIGNIEFNS